MYTIEIGAAIKSKKLNVSRVTGFLFIF